MKKRVIIAVCVIAAVFAGSVAAILIMKAYAPVRPVAVISRDGEVLYRIDLANACEEYTLTIPSADGGFNTVTVRSGSIAVTDADCPSRTCVNTGFISDSSKPIICIPHKLEIRIINGSDEIDGVAG